jgi:hypothetical protein
MPNDGVKFNCVPKASARSKIFPQMGQAMKIHGKYATLSMA